MNIQRLVTRLIAALLLTTTLLAHHGTSVSYEMNKTISVAGTATEFDFGYPHPALFFDVRGEKGEIVKWGAEFLPTPAVLRNLGWTKETIKSGDTVVLGCHPSRSGRPVCALQTITINGKVAPLGAGPGAPPAGGTQRGQRP